MGKIRKYLGVLNLLSIDSLGKRKKRRSFKLFQIKRFKMTKETMASYVLLSFFEARDCMHLLSLVGPVSGHIRENQ